MSEAIHKRLIDSALIDALGLLPGLAWIAGPDGRLEWASRALSAMIGKPEDHLSSIVHPDDWTRYQTQCIANRSVQTSGPCRVRLRSANNTYRWHLLQSAAAVEGVWIGTAADVHAEVTAIETLSQDNAELEQDIFTQLHELNRSRSRLQTIFDACPDYLYLLRLKDAVVTFEDVNLAAKALFDDAQVMVPAARSQMSKVRRAQQVWRRTCAIRCARESAPTKCSVGPATDRR